MDRYIPPYQINDEHMRLVTEIMESLGSLNSANQLEKLPRLRRVSRIKSIYSSLAIENNTLTIEQVTDVIEGKRVLGVEDDIIAVKNAYECYKLLDTIDPYDVDCLLSTHGTMMQGLVVEAGALRTTEVGVYNEEGRVIHIAPPHEMVPSLISQLLDWARDSKAHMLIKSCVFHYEFEFIHPFRDGNGRMGRLWQTALLATWRPIFQWIPIESIVKERQEEYYNAIASSTSDGNSDVFIEFMLNAINDVLHELIADTRNHVNHINSRITALLGVMDSYPMSIKELMNKLNLRSREGFRRNYLIPAIDAGLIEMSNPQKPTSPDQMYIKK